MSSNLESNCSSRVSTLNMTGIRFELLSDELNKRPTNAVNSCGLEISPGASVGGLEAWTCLKEAVGVLFLSSAFGVEMTFKGRAEDDIEADVGLVVTTLL